MVEKAAAALALIDAWAKDHSSVQEPTREKVRALVDGIGGHFEQRS